MIVFDQFSLAVIGVVIVLWCLAAWFLPFDDDDDPPDDALPFA